MNPIKYLFNRNRIKRLLQEIEFLKPLDNYLSRDYLWFDLNWRLARRYLIILEGKKYNRGLNREQILTVSAELIDYLNTIIDYIDNRIERIQDYFRQNDAKISSKNFDKQFFESYFELIPKMSEDLRNSLYLEKVSINTINHFCRMMFFFDEVLQRIKVIEYRINELNNILHE